MQIMFGSILKPQIMASCGVGVFEMVPNKKAILDMFCAQLVFGCRTQFFL